MRYHITNAERETTIRFDAEERVAHIYTNMPPYIRRLDKLCERYPEEYRLVSRDDSSAKYTCPARRIRFGKPGKKAQKESPCEDGDNCEETDEHVVGFDGSDDSGEEK